MNKTMIQRLRTAAGYQRKAIRALIGEDMCRHIDVIEKELLLMAAELGKKSAKQDKETKDKEEKSGVRKITVD